MNVTVSVECFKTLMIKKMKTPSLMIGPLYQRIGSDLASTGFVSLFFFAVVLSWDIGFLRVQSQTSWNYIQVPLPPICRSLQKITTENRLWCSISFNKPHHFPPIQAFTRQDCSIFQKQYKPCIRIAVVFFMDESQQELSQKTRTEILSAPVCLGERAIHHAVHWSQVMNDNLPTCDRAMDLVENDLEMLNIFSFPVLSFSNL